MYIVSSYNAEVVVAFDNRFGASGVFFTTHHNSLMLLSFDKLFMSGCFNCVLTFPVFRAQFLKFRFDMV